MNLSEVLLKVHVEMEDRLNQLSKDKILDLVRTLMEEKPKGEVANFIASYLYFDFEEIIEAADAVGSEAVGVILGEPGDEDELVAPVQEWFQEKGFASEQDVTPPDNGRRKPINLVTYREEDPLHAEEVTAVDIAVEARKREVESAFDRASSYRRYADYVYIAFSPLVYVKYEDVIQDLSAESEGIGVLVSDTSSVMTLLSEPERTGISEEERSQLADLFVEEQ